MIRYALDTSVLLHWFNQTIEAKTERALRLREEHLAETIELIIVDQSVFELVHILKESARFDQELIEKALSNLEYMHINIFPYNYELAHKTVQIACEHNISIYAACFAALGAHLRCQAVTSDESLYRKIASLPWTILLENLNI